MSEDEGEGDLGAGRYVGLRQFVEDRSHGHHTFVVGCVADHAATTERAPGQRREARFHGQVEDAVVDRGELRDRELGLHGLERDVRREVSGERAGLCRRIVRRTEVKNLAGANKRSEGVGGLGRMGEQIGSVDLVQVDHVGPESTERGITGGRDVGGRCVVGDSEPDATFELDAALRGQHHPVTKAGRGRKHLTKQFLGGAPGAVIVQAVDIGRVNQGHPGVDGGANATLRRGEVGAAETPASKGDGPDAQACRPDRSLFHGSRGYVSEPTPAFGDPRVASLPMQELRYGVIGTGMMGCEHLRNLVALPDVRVTAIADPIERSREWAAAVLEDQPPHASHGDFRELLSRKDVDAVVIVTPNHTHADVVRTIYAERPDLHVMIEKPLCTTVGDCQSLVQGAASHRGIVWVGLEYRYMPPVARFLAELRQPEIGKLRMLAIREHRFPFLVKVGDWNRFTANTGGTLVEKCCHFFDLMNLAVGSRPVRVMASGGQDHNHLDEFYETTDGPKRADILDNAYVIVEYANGVRTMLDLCMFAEGGPNEQELVATGTLGKVEAFVPSGEVRVGLRGGPLRVSGASTSKGVRVIDASHDERVAHAGFHHGASYLEHVDFAAAIRHGTQPLVTLDDGLWSVAVGVAAHRSIDERRPVDLSELGLSEPAGRSVASTELGV